MPLTFRRLLPALALCALALPALAAPGDLPLRLALDTDGPGFDEASVARGAGHLFTWPFTATAGHWNEAESHVRVSESLTRRMLVHLVPQLQERGYTVVRVTDAEKAINGGNFNAAARVHVDARNVYVVSDAAEFDKAVVANTAVGVSVYTKFHVWGGSKGRKVGHGEIPRWQSAVHDSPSGGAPVVDDEEAVARLLADELAKALGQLLDVADGAAGQ